MSEQNVTARWGLVSVSATALLLLGSAAASADRGEEAPPPAEEIDGSTHSHFVLDTNGADFVLDINPADFVKELGSSESEQEEVIILETDILFPAMEWELPATASPRLAELVEVIPEGTQVQVQGHTDSNPVPESYDFDNQVLSENRAQAVADALAESRPDLILEVEGFGDSDPAVAEDPEDPSTFAANRRVEIRYG